MNGQGGHAANILEHRIPLVLSTSLYGIYQQHLTTRLEMRQNNQDEIIIIFTFISFYGQGRPKLQPTLKPNKLPSIKT